MKKACQSRELTRFNKRPDRSRSGQSPDLWIEPERYELHAVPLYRFEVDRREFFKVLGCGVVVLCFVEVGLAQESGRRGQGRGGRRPSEISAWLHIGEDGSITVFTGKVEVGQNSRTSLRLSV